MSRISDATAIIGAATIVIQRSRAEEPIYRHYQQLLDGGTKPNR